MGYTINEHKILVSLHKSPSETLRVLEEAYGKAAMKKAQVYGWHKRLRDGRASDNVDPRCGQLSESTNDANVERVHNYVRSDRRKSIQEISVEVRISAGRVYGILQNI
jgi:hypothetical protein